MLVIVASPPTFTVVMPAYNASRTIANAIESLLAQTVPPAEIVVVDDGSTDSTGEIARSFGPPVRTIVQENAGTAAARNRGLSVASGDVISFLDADDLYEVDRLEKIGALFAAEPELEAVATDAAIETPGSRKLVSSWWPPAANRERLDASAPIVFCTLALRRELVAKLGGFKSRYQIVEDLEYWYRIGCRRHLVGYVPEPSYRYLIQEDSKTSTRSSVRGHSEFVAINFSYALAPRTPLHLRARLGVRGLRHLKHAVVALVRHR
ncbi:MAG TPA: glycosyltransferase [Gaiellaceae bacterium]|jgi:glycosyltransferase involved in cell wall biosynthesis